MSACGCSLNPVSGIIQRETPLHATPHHHRLYVTGWAEVTPDGQGRIGVVRVQGLAQKWNGTRVSALLYPGHVRRKVGQTRAAWVRPAAPLQANDARWELVGHLVRADRAESVLRVVIYPQQPRLPRFQLELRATRQVFQTLSPDWSGVRLTGSLLDEVMLTETVEPVYAPVAPHWGRPSRPKKVRSGE